MKIEVSNGELIDKFIILRIKLEEIKEETKRDNLQKEYNELKPSAAAVINENDTLFKELYDVNRELWDIENKIRILEKEQSFGKEFIEVARSVYIKNDLRFEIKRKINIQTSSHFSEEKSYQK